MSNKEEREFQISLVELQADVQINLGLSLAFFAGGLAILLAFEQFLLAIPSEQTLSLLAFCAMIILGSVTMIECILHMKRFWNSRNEISKLREKFTS